MQHCWPILPLSAQWTKCKLKQYLLLDIFFLHIFGLQYHRPICLQPYLFRARFFSLNWKLNLNHFAMLVRFSIFGKTVQKTPSGAEDPFEFWMSDQGYWRLLFLRDINLRMWKGSAGHSAASMFFFILGALCPQLDFELFGSWIESRIWGLMGPSSRSIQKLLGPFQI